MMNSPGEQRPSGEKDALQYETQFRSAVEEGLAEADRGDLLDHEEVVERIEHLFRT